MSRAQGLSATTEAAWTGFRSRLADHIAVMDDDDVLVLEFDGVVPDDEIGSAPYVQLCAYDHTLVRLEAASNEWLHERCALGADDLGALRELGWLEPKDEPGWENFHVTFERRSADEAAVLAVRTLREVYGAPHPAFLLAGGLETDPDAVVASVVPPDVADAEVDGGEQVSTFARDREHLQELVDAAMRVAYPDLKHDSDGDIPILAGDSAVFIRVRDDRPSVEVFAHLVLDVEDIDRLPTELDLLNAGHPMWKFYCVGGTVKMRDELLTVPLAPIQLRWVVERFVAEVDEIARALTVRVGGRRFLEHDPAQVDEPRSEVDDHPAMTGLLELLHLERVRPTTVAGLFAHDRLEIIGQLVRIRTGRQSCAEHDPDVVLTLLRKALRVVSDGEPVPGRAVPVPPKARSVQESLLPDGDLGDATLELGWLVQE